MSSRPECKICGAAVGLSGCSNPYFGHNETVKLLGCTASDIKRQALEDFEKKEPMMDKNELVKRFKATYKPKPIDFDDLFW